MFTSISKIIRNISKIFSYFCICLFLSATTTTITSYSTMSFMPKIFHRVAIVSNIALLKSRISPISPVRCISNRQMSSTGKNYCYSVTLLKCIFLSILFNLFIMKTYFGNTSRSVNSI